MTDQSEKVDLATPDLAAANRDALAALFPGVLADGVLDATRLGELLDIPVTAPTDGRERFGLMWAGKQEAVRSLLTPSRGALVPHLERSVDFDTAENVFIEGDNLEVLKLLQKAYNDKVKLIYIDPPYNTGKDFVYDDDFRDGLSGYLAYTGQLDEDGNRTSASVDVEGRRHSKWLSMMYPRLVLGRNLLTQDGVMFISIDDNEVANLRLICDEIFGPENFVENYVWESNFRPDNSSAVERENSQHILAYARAKREVKRLVGTQRKSEGLPSLTKNSMGVRTLRLEPDWVEFSLADGSYGPGDMGSGYVLEDEVTIFDGRAADAFRLSGRVIWSQQYLEAQVREGTKIVIKAAGFVPYSRKLATAPLPPTSLISRDEVGDVLAGNADLRALFGDVPFNHPKPVSLLSYLTNAVTHDDQDALVLDFFAGSGSTAHAVASLNDADGGSRRVISVNLPEPVLEGSVAAKMGFSSVSQITEERIRRSQTLYPSASAAGLRVYILAESSFRRSHEPTDRSLLDLQETTLRASEPPGDDVVSEVLLAEGVPLGLEWTRHDLAGTHVVSSGAVAVVASLHLDEKVVDEILELDARVVVFLEDGFVGKDAVRANAFTQARQLGITMKTV